MRIAFVTGATGFLGSHFILNATDVLYDKFILMVRGEDHATRLRKVKLALQTAKASYKTPFDVEHTLSNCQILNGDLQLPRCGIDIKTFEAALDQNPYDLWNFAAVMFFEDKRKELVDSINIKGSKEVLSVAKILNPSRFFYVSTAYTCGKQEGLIPESLHPITQDFANIYERSKCISEHNIVNTCNHDNINWIILRPAIVIGNSETKKTGGTDSGFYTFVKQISGINKVSKNIQETIRIYGNPRAIPNIIPVDIAIKEFISIAQDLDSNNNIFHVASHTSPSIQFFVKEITRQLNTNNITMALFDKTECSPVERFAAKHTKIYASYFKHIRVFNSKRKFKNHVSALDTSAYISEGLQDILRVSESHVFNKKTVKNNKEELTFYTAGDSANPAVLLINAHSMPIQFLSPLAKTLTKSYFVITWETTLTTNKTALNSHHTSTARTIIDSLKVNNFHIIGWCTGAGIAAQLALEQPNLVDKLVLLNGSLLVKDFANEKAAYTEFEESMLSLMPRIAYDESFAKLMHAVVFKKTTNLRNSLEEELSINADNILTAVDPSIMHLTNKPFETPESLQNHARLIKGHIESFPKDLHKIQNKTLIITGSNDNTSSVEMSRASSKLIKDSHLEVINGGGHFLLYNSTEYMLYIIDFLKKDKEEMNIAI